MCYDAKQRDRKMGNQAIQKRSHAMGWHIVFINAVMGCGIASAFPQFSMTIGNLSEASGLTPAILMGSDTVKAAAIVLGMLVSGFAYNKFGARAVFIFSLLTSAIPQFLMPYIESAFSLMALKTLQGLAGIVFPIFLVIILNAIDDRHAGLSTAIFNGVFYAGGGIGGTMAGFVIVKYDWVASFYFLGYVQLALGIVWLLTVREARPAQRANTLPTTKPSPPAKKSLLASPVLWLLALCLFATTWSAQAVTVDWVIFGEWLGYDELALGKILNAVTLGIILSCIISGRVSDFFAKSAKSKSLARIGVLMAGYVMIIASVCFLTLGNMRDYDTFLIATFLFTFSASWGFGTFYSILPEIYDGKTVPVVTGITGGLGDIGMPVAPLAVGVVFGLKGMWSTGWATCAAIALCSFIAGLTLIALLKDDRSVR